MVDVTEPNVRDNEYDRDIIVIVLCSSCSSSE